MCEKDREFRHLMESVAMNTTPDPEHTEAVRRQTLSVARRAGNRPGYRRIGLIAAVVVLGVCGIGLAATETGRNLIRSIFTPIGKVEATQWEAPDGTVYTESRNTSEPYTGDEERAATNKFQEIHALQDAGQGKLVGLAERSGDTGFFVQYELGDGTTTELCQGRPTGKQAENMRIDEIMELRDAGAGEVVSEQPFVIGLGRYTIRFTLSDGQAVDLTANYPPGKREEREALFAETEELKSQLRFTVLNPHVDPQQPEAGVWGLLRYELADGRTVGLVQRVPDEAISEDGRFVVLPDLAEPVAITGASNTPD
jgi:hypothetical protein